MLCIVIVMSEYDQPSSTPGPELSAEDDEALMKMQRDFPGHRIWREIIPGRTVYVARSQHPAAHPHTVVTPHLRELQITLAQASQTGRPR
jgi:hypothetical protein